MSVDLSNISETYRRELELCAQELFYWTHYVQTDDEERQLVRRFPSDLEYLHSLDAVVNANQKTIVLKPRRMKVSWYGMLRQLHRAVFAGSGLPGAPETFFGGVMTIGELEAQYLMERLPFVWLRLPEWMRAFNPLVKDNEMIKVFANGAKIQAFPLKRHGPQTFGFSEVFFDEMAWQEAVRGVWKGMIPTLGGSGKLIAVSTPNGKYNLFHDVWENKDQKYTDVARWECDWWDDPEHDENWYKKATAGMTQNEVNQMFLKSFAVPEGEPVYGTFNRMVNVADETPLVPGRCMYIGWDLGFHFPAVQFWQRNSRDQWVGHRMLQGYDESFDDFCDRAIELANSFYDRDLTDEIHCMPPDCLSAYRTRGRTGAMNDYQVVKKVWKHLGNEPRIYIAHAERQTRKIESPRLKETRDLWKLRKDGEPGAFCNKSMTMFIEACEGGYCYREHVDEEPTKNEYCVPLSVPALTPDGWKTYDQLSAGDPIYTFDMEAKRLTIGAVLAVNTFQSAPLVSVGNDHSEIICTPNHRHVVRTSNGVYAFRETTNLKDGLTLFNAVTPQREPKARFSKEFCTLCGWIVAEGTYRHDGSIVMEQSLSHNPHFVKQIDAITKGFPNIGRHEGRGMAVWHIGKETAWLIRQWMPDKYPSMGFIRAMSRTERVALLQAFFDGDGHRSTVLRASQKRLDVTEAMQTLAFLAGESISICRRSEDYTLTWRRYRTTHTSHFSQVQLSPVPVWCPTTTHGTWVMRQGGRTWITGNSHCVEAWQYIVVVYNHISASRTAERDRSVQQQAIRKRIGLRTGL